MSGTVHATCVAQGEAGVLLFGRSGSGKSDLALRLIDRGWMLVSDDYTVVAAADGRLTATPPARIAGLLEVRGVGIVTLPHRAAAAIRLACDLDAPVPRLPVAAVRTVAGVALPQLAVAAREPSAPIKIELALKGLRA